MINILPPQLEAFKQRIGVSLDRIHLIQDGIVEQHAEMYKWLKDSGYPEDVILQHLGSAKLHLNNLKNTQSQISGL